MKDINEVADFSIFSGISNLINNANTLDDDELAYLERMVHNYINSNGTQGECLLETLDRIKENRNNDKSTL